MSHLRVVLRKALYACSAVVLSMSGLLSFAAQPAYADSYLDGEVTYTGTLAQSHDWDVADGIEDGVCHDGEGGEGPEVSCDMRGDDDYSKPIDIGFNFDYYGVTYSQLTANMKPIFMTVLPPVWSMAMIQRSIVLSG